MRCRNVARAGWLPLLVVAAIAAPAAEPAAQSLAVTPADGGLRVSVSRLSFIEGDVLERLRDGRTVVVQFELAVLLDPRGPVIWQGLQRFSVSFDIWEERFAVARSGTPPQSVSHLTARDAESWCLGGLALPPAALSPLGRGAPFWVRLTYRIDQPGSAQHEDEDTRFTLTRLIDILGRRGGRSPAVRTVEAGPFRVPG